MTLTPTHRPARSRRSEMLIGLIATAAVLAGCGSTSTYAKSTTGADLSAVTTVPAGPTTPPPTTPPTSCLSGPLSLGPLGPGSGRTVCVEPGGTVTVVFDKSPGSWGGTAGDWFASPLSVTGTPGSLRVLSETVAGQTLKAELGATSPGTTGVTARFEVTCSSADTSPCTIPPEGQISLTVNVVAPKAASPGSGWLTGEMTLEGGPITPPAGQPPTRPLSGTVVVSLSGRQVASVVVGADGRFSVELPAGRTYQIEACTSHVEEVNPGGKTSPTCSGPVPGSVRSGVTTPVDIPPFIVP